jgi:NAD(P)-dependent dehydrogenase (short-subunit alcohol dehydrogenase family)
LSSERSRTVVITGAATGIGRGLAFHFAGTGATLILNDIDEAGLRRTSAELDEQTRVIACSGDVADDRTIAALTACMAAADDFSLLVNNAGLTKTYERFLDMTLAAWDRIFSVNLRAPFALCQAAARCWIERGTPGAIVNVSSPGASRAHRDNSIYDASKGGLEALTRALAVDLGPFGIRVNAVAPAAVKEFAAPIPNVPLQRAATAQDIAEAVEFLSTAAAVTGHVVPVDGGLLAQLRPLCAEVSAAGAPTTGQREARPEQEHG